MPDHPLSEKDLRSEFDDYKDLYPHLGIDNIFIAWFLRAFLTENIDDAVSALTGGSNDKGIDAIFIDQKTKNIFIIQGKYRHTIGVKHESRADLISFATIPTLLSGTLEGFKGFCSGITPSIEEKLRTCRSHILRHNYLLQMYYVTTGLVSKDLAKEADKHAMHATHPGKCHVIAGNHILDLLADYLDGVAPPVPSLDLFMGGVRGAQVSEAFHRYDRKTDIESWLFSMTGKSVGDLYLKTGNRLFARNVRGFLGNTRINDSIKETIKDEPENFWYYNNGITIICDLAEQIKSRGHNKLRVSNPQIINGQQTTRTLAGLNGNAAKASVVVKVIRVPRKSGSKASIFKGLVSQIVLATNSQNAIRPSDLISNDRIQVGIQREMRKLRYWYIRKRQTKSEARQRSGSLDYYMIQKFEVAQAVAGCNMDPSIIRGGREHLFEEPLYQEVFPTSDPYYFLCRYWLMRRVEAVARGFPERAYAKWMVLNFMWARFEHLVNKRSEKEKFVRVSVIRSDRGRYVISRLDKCIEKAFIGASRFFKANRGQGTQALDASGFYKRRKLHEGFAKYWKSQANKSRNPFNSNWERFKHYFVEYEV